MGEDLLYATVDGGQGFVGRSMASPHRLDRGGIYDAFCREIIVALFETYKWTESWVKYCTQTSLSSVPHSGNRPDCSAGLHALDHSTSSPVSYI